MSVPITLDTNRADLISVKVADYVSIGGSMKVTILVQVGCRPFDQHDSSPVHFIPHDRRLVDTF